MTISTRAFARVLGPYLVIVPGVIVARTPEAAALVVPFFSNPALVWIIGAMMVFGGIFVIANHQVWRSASAVMVSLFGWFLGLRGLLLLIVPEEYQRLSEASRAALPQVRQGFSILVLVGLWLTYDGWIAGAPNGAPKQQ